LSFIYEGEYLFLSDMKVIASLPCLRSLRIGSSCVIVRGAVSALSRCSELRHLEIDWDDELTDVHRVIQGNLISLKLRDVIVDAIASVVEYCSNLQYLEVWAKEVDTEIVEVIKRDLKTGLKKLAKLNVNGVSVRLGSDWTGYLQRRYKV
jgi:hypothetical protein